MIDHGFQTPLDARKISEAPAWGRARWRLLAPLIFNSKKVGLIIANTGYESDFASVPRAPVAFWLTGDTAHASDVVHDILCSEWIPAKKITWADAADVWKEAAACEGVPEWRINVMYQAILSADPDKKWEPMP